MWDPPTHVFIKWNRRFPPLWNWLDRCLQGWLHAKTPGSIHGYGRDVGAPARPSRQRRGAVGESTGEDLRSAPLDDSDMVLIPQPPGMPRGWDQPNSTGVFQEHGKCGPTALANELLLYGISETPDELFDEGVQFAVGTLPFEIEDWLAANDPQLGCKIAVSRRRDHRARHARRPTPAIP